ncbi:hypothetical protein D3C72_2207000 [compost metagenome]
MYCHINLTSQHGLFNLFDKKPFATHFGQGYIQYSITLGQDFLYDKLQIHSMLRA